MQQIHDRVTALGVEVTGREIDENALPAAPE
jgi:hypothetical protein